MKKLFVTMIAVVFSAVAMPAMAQTNVPDIVVRAKGVEVARATATPGQVININLTPPAATVAAAVQPASPGTTPPPADKPAISTGGWIGIGATAAIITTVVALVVRKWYKDHPNRMTLYNCGGTIATACP